MESAARLPVTTALLVLLLVAPACEGPGLWIVEPPPGAVLTSPSVEVRVVLWPPLAAGETVVVDLFAGVDGLDPAPIEPRRLAGPAHVPTGAETFSLRIEDLPPGRSTLQVVRFGGDGWHPQAAVSKVLDRGGFAAEGEAPFEAGVLAAELVRASTLDPASERVLALLVWYPSATTEPPDPSLRGVRDAPFVAGAEELPAVVYSHGNCGSADAFTTLASALARAGFLVASISHPGDTGSDRPECAGVNSQARSFFERPGDVMATLDWLVALPAPDVPGGWLVDPARMGVAGHSFGGQTTLMTADREPRLRAALALAPPIQQTRSALPLTIPAMIQGASLDTTTPFAEQQALFALLEPPRLLVEVLGEGHSAFTDGAPAATRALVVGYALGFLGTYLAADARWDALLTPSAGALLEEDRPPVPRRTPCTNGLDDDGDGLVDAAWDPGCADPDGQTELPRHTL